MHLVGLLLHGVLSNQLKRPSLQRRAKSLRGEYGVAVGEMAVTLCFSEEGIVIRKGIATTCRARISGSMAEMVPIVSGAGGLAAALIAVLEGRIHIGGNPFALLGLLPVLLPAGKRRLPPARPD